MFLLDTGRYMNKQKIRFDLIFLSVLIRTRLVTLILKDGITYAYVDNKLSVANQNFKLQCIYSEHAIHISMVYVSTS